MGYVEPRNIGLRMENATPLVEQDIVTGRRIKFTFAIWDCVVSVECETERFDREEISRLYTRSLEFVRIPVELIALKHGWGLSVYLDRFIPETGREETIMPRQDNLNGIVDAYDTGDIDGMLATAAADPNIYMALTDLVEAIRTPRSAAINCARAIEGMRTVVAPPGTPRDRGWPILREALNVDQAFLTRITNLSTAPRHGDRIFVTDVILMKTIEDSWKVMNRFLIYIRHGRTALDPSVYPTLA